MLVDIPEWHTEPTSLLLSEAGYTPQRLERACPGMYWGHEQLIEHIVVNSYPYMPRAGLTVEESFAQLRQQLRNDDPEGFGVCDSPEQILARWPQLRDDPRSFVVLLSMVERSDQSETGGWRWHKHGEYIGTRTPTREYLYDENEISSVVCFHIVEVELERCVELTQAQALASSTGAQDHVREQSG